MLGGQYKLNLTEASIYKRFWMGSWGYIDNRLNVGHNGARCHSHC